MLHLSDCLSSATAFAMLSIIIRTWLFHHYRAASERGSSCNATSDGEAPPLWFGSNGIVEHRVTDPAWTEADRGRIAGRMKACKVT